VFPYDTRFASIVTSDHIAALRESYAAGHVPYRSDDASGDRDTANRPVLAPDFGAARVGCDAKLSQRAA